MTDNPHKAPLISTWDDAAVASEPPYGACIVVRRGVEYARIRLDDEHVGYRWVELGEAIRLCRPQGVADGLAMAGLI